MYKSPSLHDINYWINLYYISIKFSSLSLLLPRIGGSVALSQELNFPLCLHLNSSSFRSFNSCQRSLKLIIVIFPSIHKLNLPDPDWILLTYTHTHTHTYIYIYIYILGAYDKLTDFFVWVLLLIVHSWNSSPLRSNLLQLQCTCFTVPTTSERPHGSPLVWACQWPSS